MMFLANEKIKLIIGATLIALLALGAIGLYLKGRSDGVALTEAKVAEEKLQWERKVADLQSKYREDIITIVTQYDQTVLQYQEEISKLIDNPKVVDRYINRYVPVETQCTIPEGFVELHNKSAEGARLGESPSNASRPSDKTLSQVGQVVAQNYYQCNEIRVRLEALQQVVQKYQKQQEDLIK
jgi:hypothetical protein